MDGRVVAHHRDAERAGVEAAGVGALHVLGQPAVAALVDVAVLVHQRVVADVLPAAGDRVVLVNAPHDARGLGLRVVVRAGGVVDAGRAEVGVVRRGSAAGLVGSPAGAGDHARHAGDVGVVGHGLDALGGHAAVDEHALHVMQCHGAEQVGQAGEVPRAGSLGDVDEVLEALPEDVEAERGDLHCGGAADVDRLRAQQPVALLAGGVLRVRGEPLGPGAVRALGAEEGGHLGGFAPGQGEHGEFAVVAQLLDQAAVGVEGLDQSAGGHGGVVDDDRGGVGKRLAGQVHVDGARGGGLQEAQAGAHDAGVRDGRGGRGGGGHRQSRQEGATADRGGIDATTSRQESTPN